MRPLKKLPITFALRRSGGQTSPKKHRKIIQNVIYLPKLAATKMRRRHAALRSGEVKENAFVAKNTGSVPGSGAEILPSQRLNWNMPETGPICEAGDMQVYVSQDPEVIRAAQALRYQVFYEEMDAEPSPENRALGLDVDKYDAICDHLIVLDRTLPDGEQLVGCYRLLRGEVAQANGGFYSAGEYDISSLLRIPPERLLELGRSCVLESHRSKKTIQLLWRGITAYLTQHDLTTLFGCASFPGRDPAAHAEALSCLYHFNSGEEADPKVRALDHLHSEMNLIPKDEVNTRQALRNMPPLIKAYLRLGGVFGDGAVVDEQFGTVDVFVAVHMEKVGSRYYTHFDKRDG